MLIRDRFLFMTLTSCPFPDDISMFHLNVHTYSYINILLTHMCCFFFVLLFSVPNIKMNNKDDIIIYERLLYIFLLESSFCFAFTCELLM